MTLAPIIDLQMYCNPTSPAGGLASPIKYCERSICWLLDFEELELQERQLRSQQLRSPSWEPLVATCTWLALLGSAVTKCFWTAYGFKDSAKRNSTIQHCFGEWISIAIKRKHAREICSVAGVAGSIAMTILTNRAIDQFFSIQERRRIGYKATTDERILDLKGRVERLGIKIAVLQDEQGLLQKCRDLKYASTDWTRLNRKCGVSYSMLSNAEKETQIQTINACLPKLISYRHELRLEIARLIVWAINPNKVQTA